MFYLEFVIKFLKFNVDEGGLNAIESWLMVAVEDGVAAAVTEEVKVILKYVLILIVQEALSHFHLQSLEHGKSQGFFY